MKAVNLEARPIMGASDMSFTVGSWVGKCNFTTVSLDDFDVILGVDFFLSVEVSVMPHLGGILICDDKSPSFVSSIFVDQSDRVNKNKGLLSAMQLKDGLRQGDMTYLAILVEIKLNVCQNVPDAVAKVLDEYADIMLPELPKELPRRRATDHKIELIPGTIPRAQAPYRMLPVELVELRN
jgi:hypothetical protein